MYKLSCAVQNYDWGKFGSDSLVAEIFSKNGGSVDSTKTYAEYWMGTHINGPSFINSNIENSKISLSEFLKENHNQEGLPFLFKVLSIKDALSIQAHPDKQFAEVLHSIDKAHYKDDNHKPELAVAISEKFKLFYGILNIEEALKVSENLFEAINKNNNDRKFYAALQNFLSNKNNSKNYYELICEIIKLDDEETKFIIESLLNYIENKEEQNLHKNFKLVKFLFSKFQYDKGIIFSIYMNYYEMNKGDALFITPNIPHAYIEGDCIECMANSDNVIRLGLTPKFVDTENFLKILEKRFDEILQKSFTRIGEKISQNTLLFKNQDFKEFYVTKIELDSDNNKESIFYSENFSILFVLSGEPSFIIEKLEQTESYEKNIQAQALETYFIEKGTKIKINSNLNSSNNIEIYVASYDI